MKIRILILTALLVPLFLSALECSQCGKHIRGNYIKTKDAAFCSKRCYRKILPRCEKCGKACENGYVTMMNKKFCSKNCMEREFRCAVCRQGMQQTVIITTPAGRQVMVCNRCSKAPKCYFCALPTVNDVLADGRNICAECQAAAVNDPVKIRQIFQQIRNDLARWYGFDNRHRIQLKVVDHKELSRVGKDTYQSQGGRRLALMQYQQEITERRLPSGRKERFVSKEVCRIYVLSSTPELMLRDALAHELTHDHLRHKIGAVKNLAKEEGFCELVASLYNIKTGNPDLNKNKDANQDPVYGDGFRQMRSIYKQCGSLHKTMQQIR